MARPGFGEIAVPPGSKIGVQLIAGAMATTHAVVRAELATKVPDGDLQTLRSIDLKAALETLEAIPPPAPPVDSKDAKGAAPPSPPQADPSLPPREVLTVQAPGLRADEIPEGAALYLRNFEVSLNGKNFTRCAEGQPMKLELLPKMATPDS